MTPEEFKRIQAQAREELRQIAKVYPAAFDKNGRAIVASAHFPRLPKASTGGGK